MTKTILITGASSGFGRDTAETLARAGYRVFAAMRDIAERNRGHADALRSQKIGVVELDVTDDGSVDRAIASVLAEAGRIDVLINNAGMASAGVSEAFTPDQAKVVFNTNVIGVLRATRAVLPAMRAVGDGLIVNIGSVLGRVTFPFFGIRRIEIRSRGVDRQFPLRAVAARRRGRVGAAQRLPDQHVCQHPAARRCSARGGLWCDR
jgi:NADP-dependent 3-hydroxy acid dehydrogenase YdfG